MRVTSRPSPHLPEVGSEKFTQSVMLAKGDSGVPLGLKLSVSGRVRGRSCSLMACGSCTSICTLEYLEVFWRGALRPGMGKVKRSCSHLGTLREDDGEGLSPIPLPRKEPVAQLVIDLC